jgi:N-methylhydantoinase A/oxoprolinase/acetone carboxylase beta subunit
LNDEERGRKAVLSAFDCLLKELLEHGQESVEFDEDRETRQAVEAHLARLKKFGISNAQTEKTPEEIQEDRRTFHARLEGHRERRVQEVRALRDVFESTPLGTDVPQDKVELTARMFETMILRNIYAGSNHRYDLTGKKKAVSFAAHAMRARTYALALEHFTAFGYEHEYPFDELA